MATRLHLVERSRKEYQCGKCGETIPVGSPYYWFKFRYGGKQVRCQNHRPTPIDLEGNYKRQLLMRAADSLATAREDTDPNSASGYLQDAVDSVQEAIDEFQSALDGWSYIDGFSTSPTAEAFEQCVYDLEDWRDRAQSACDELQDADPEDETFDVFEVMDGVDDVPDVDF